MGEWVKLQASDGNELAAYVARPEGAAIGALVLMQEIFGVNAHIRSVADGYAKDGFVVIAPALFDRFEKGVELKYDGSDMQRAFGLYGQLKPETSLTDIAAAYEYLKPEGEGDRRDRLLLRRPDGVAERHSGRDVQDAARLHGGLLRWRHRQLCHRGAGVPGDAALRRQGLAHWAGAD